MTKSPEAKPVVLVILRRKQVGALDGKSDSQRKRDIRAGRYPVPVRIGPRSLGWYAHEIEAYLKNLPRVGGPTRRGGGKP